MALDQPQEARPVSGQRPVAAPPCPPGAVYPPRVFPLISVQPCPISLPCPIALALRNELVSPSSVSAVQAGLVE